MSDAEKRICRYFNTFGGCWYGDSCKFLHIINKKPPCRFHGQRSTMGCRFGESCHFSHERAPLKAVENIHEKNIQTPKNTFKENSENSSLSGTNNNNMTLPQTTGDVPELVNDNISHKIGDTETSEIYSEAILGEINTFNQDVNDVIEEVDKTVNSSPVEESDVTILTNSSSQQVPYSDVQIFCGSCKRALERQGNESYCNLLKDHYLECFLDKEGDHVKCVKMKAALEHGQMYWCKTCILIFEKPWSLFQHMADKAKGAKVQRWERKIHIDWIDSVAGLMAGHDLGLFSPMKLRADLRNLLADQHTVEEELEAAAVAAAAMVQWLVPMSSPWRLHQREMMRRIENLHRQVMRKAGGAAALARAVISVGAVSPYSGYTGVRNSLPEPRHSRHSTSIQEADDVVQAPTTPSPALPGGCNAGASGDHIIEVNSDDEKRCTLVEEEQEERSASVPVTTGDSNNTNSVTLLQGENSSDQCKAGAYITGQRPKCNLTRWFNEERSTRGFRGGLSYRQRNFAPSTRNFDNPRTPRYGSFTHSFRSLPASTGLPVCYDMNCGFTDEEVEELLSQGIKPWDSEATAALAVLHGEMDHLLK